MYIPQRKSYSRRVYCVSVNGPQISHMSFRLLACDLRQTLKKQGFFINSCPADSEPDGGLPNRGIRVGFDSRLKLKFIGSQVTIDTGLLADRELDEAIGLTEIGRHGSSRRRSTGIRHVARKNALRDARFLVWPSPSGTGVGKPKKTPRARRGGGAILNCEALQARADCRLSPNRKCWFNES